MILYYAIGGGLGHLTRARAVVHTLGIKERVVLVTASPFALDSRVASDFDVVSVPNVFATDLASYKSWLGDLVERLSPSEIYLDTFPAGIVGEFCDFSFPRNLAVHYVGRLLRWTQYAKVICGVPPEFEISYVAEELCEEHTRYIGNQSRRLVRLALEDPPQRPSKEVTCLYREFEARRRPRWLVVHSGPEEEVAQLLAYARQLCLAETIEPELLLISPGLPREILSAVRHLDVYPATTLFSYADRVITACGFNLMRQTEGIRDRHRFVPFSRRFDDQYLRAARRRARTGAQRSALVHG
jgi:hypothetical protein